jgi:O-antigen/teichoic acid export membrane protein
MALIDTKELPRRRFSLRLPARVSAWLSGEHALTQRMAGSAFVIRMASATIMFVSQILLARWMGSFEFGTYVYVWTWLLLLGDIAHLGVPLTAQRYIPEYTQARSFDRLRGYLSGSRWITFTFGTVAAIVGAGLIRALQNSLDQSVVMPLYLACVALPFYAFTFMLDGLACSYNWINLALMPPYVLRPVILIAAVAVAHVAGLKTDATTVTAVLAAATWLTALCQLLLLQRGLRTAVPAGPRTYEVRQWLATSLPIILVWGFYTMLTYTDVLVLKQFRPADEVAHYYAASKTLALISIIYFAVAATAAHRFTEYHVAGDRDGLATFAAGTIRWMFWPSLAAALLMLALGRPVLMLFGADFVSGYPFMAILAIGQLARASVGPAERLLNMLDQQRICALAYAVALAVNVTGCLMLAPRFGGIGVASATAGAFVVESALLFLIARRRLGLHMFIWRPRRSA